MTYSFMVDEASGEKLYWLVQIRFSPMRGAKILSKESSDGKIDFVVSFFDVNPDADEFIAEKTTHQSEENGVTKQYFEELLETIISALPAGVIVNGKDLSSYGTVKEQIDAGIDESFFNIVVQTDKKEGT